MTILAFGVFSAAFSFHIYDGTEGNKIDIHRNRTRSMVIIPIIVLSGVALAIGSLILSRKFLSDKVNRIIALISIPNLMIVAFIILFIEGHYSHY